MTSDTLLQIGEVAELTGTSRRSLRYYEQQELIAAQRDDNGYRLYRPHVVEQVHRIRGLLDLGLPVKAIGPVLRCVTSSDGGELEPSTCPELRETLRSELSRLDAMANEIDEARTSITRLLAAAEQPGA